MDMKAWRENPDGEENQRATKQTEREIFALKMQEKHELETKADADIDEMLVPTGSQKPTRAHSRNHND